MTKRRVVVTGLGAITPLGLSVETSWSGIINGQSGIAPITAYDASALSTRFCGEIKGFDPNAHFSAKEARKVDLFIQYAMAASDEAIGDAGLDFNIT